MDIFDMMPSSVTTKGFQCSLCETNSTKYICNIFSLVDHGKRIHGVKSDAQHVFVKNAVWCHVNAPLKTRKLCAPAAAPQHQSKSTRFSDGGEQDAEMQDFLLPSPKPKDRHEESRPFFRIIEDQDYGVQNSSPPVSGQIDNREASRSIFYTRVNVGHARDFPNDACCDTCHRDGIPCTFIHFGKPCFSCGSQGCCEIARVPVLELWKEFGEKKEREAELMIRFEEMFDFEEKRLLEEGLMGEEWY